MSVWSAVRIAVHGTKAGLDPAAAITDGRKPSRERSELEGTIRKHRRSQTHRAPRSRLTHKQGPAAVSPDAIVAVPGISGIWAWRSARCALWVNLDAMRVKVWPGWASPPGTTRPVRFFGETLGLEVAFDAGNTVELTAGNGDRIRLFGPGHRYFGSAPASGGLCLPGVTGARCPRQARPHRIPALPAPRSAGEKSFEVDLCSVAR